MGNTVNERELVMEVLLAVTRDGQYSHLALGSMMEKYQYLSKSERAFITRVSEGTLEHMIEIDYIINQFSKVKVNKMKPVIRAIVRNAVYQLKYMDSVPDSAVCNEAVKLAGKRGFSGLKGFVNGLLRNISRNMNRVKYPDPSDQIQWFSVTYSMPEWIVKQFLSAYPRETVKIIFQDFLKEKPTSVRCNLSRISRDELKKALEAEHVTVKLHPEIDCAMYLSGYDHLGAIRCFKQGYFQVQDVSSMEVAMWAAPKQGDSIIDVCAAPGGKSLHLADMLRGTGHVEARDLTDYKVNLILDNIERCGATNIDAVCMDATVLDEDSIGKADIVIADLPCSGLGVLGKKTDLKYKMTEEMQRDLVKLQREILSVVHRYVKPGGKLLYSTCTIHRAENEGNAHWFEVQYPEFEKVREKQFIPGVDESDGFYIAEFRRKV